MMTHGKRHAGLILSQHAERLPGKLDSTFGTSSGIVMGLVPTGYTRAGAGSILVQNDGAIVVGGTSYLSTSTSSSALTLARLSSTGRLDRGRRTATVSTKPGIDTHLGNLVHLR